MEERLFNIQIPSKKYNYLTKDDHDALYSLKDHPSITIKDAEKGSVVVWDKEGYLKEAYKQRDDRDVYEEVLNDLNVLINVIMKDLEKIRLHDDLSSDMLNFFIVKDPKFTR